MNENKYFNLEKITERRIKYYKYYHNLSPKQRINGFGLAKSICNNDDRITDEYTSILTLKNGCGRCLVCASKELKNGKIKLGKSWTDALTEKPYKTHRDDRLKNEMQRKWNKDIDSEILNAGMKEDKKLLKRFKQRINNIERYIGANKYYNMDYQNENYKYNKLRK